MAYPTVVRRGRAVSSTTNATTFAPGSMTWTTNTAISASDRVLWLLFVSADGNGTISDDVGSGSAGWAKIGQGSNSTVVTGALFTKETTGAYAASAFPAIALENGGASEQYSCVLIGLKAASGKLIGTLTATTANGSSADSNPASITNGSGASRDVTVAVFRAGDSTTVATVAPTNYGNLQSQAAGGTGGASSNSAERQLTIASAASEDPGVFTSASEQWVTYTIGVYEYDPPAPVLEQEAFQFYEDDAGLTASTAIAAQDTNITRVNGEKTQLRFRIKNTGPGDQAANAFRLYRSIDGGAYALIGSGISSDVFKLALSSNFVNGEDITATRLTGGSGTFTNGESAELNSDIPTGVALISGAYTELVWNIVNNGATAGQTCDFRVRKNDGTVLDAYDVTPRIIAVSAGSSTGKIKVYSGSWTEKPVKWYNGSTWVEKPLKVWNGSSWVLA